MVYLESEFNDIIDILRRDSGLLGTVQYTEQISWIILLKYLEDYENSECEKALSCGEDYRFIIEPRFRWHNWANIEINSLPNSPHLIEFVNNSLFPYLRALNKENQSFESKIGTIFENLQNRIKSEYILKDVLHIFAKIDFRDPRTATAIGDIYENLLRSIGSDGNSHAEFYTPRPLLKAIVEAMNPKIGQSVFDAAVGSGGFLIETYNYLLAKKTHSKDELRRLEKETLWGNERTSLTFAISNINLILHGIANPNISKKNSLREDPFENPKHDIVFVNPPFGGRENVETQRMYRVDTASTELLFLQYLMHSLAWNGKAAILLSEGVLFQTNSAHRQIKQQLVENFNVHTIVSLPPGVFLPYSAVKANIVFFDRSGPTEGICYYEITPAYSLSKTKQIRAQDFDDFISFSKKPLDKKLANQNAWYSSISEVIAKDFDLSARKPLSNFSFNLSPEELLNSLKVQQEAAETALAEIKNLWNEFSNTNDLSKNNDFIRVKLKDVAYTTTSIDPSQYSTITYLDISSINADLSSITDPKIIAGIEAPTRARKSVQKGDILFATTRPYLKNVAIVEDEYLNPVASTGICVIRPNNAIVLTEYLFLFLLTDVFQDSILQFVKGSQYPTISDKDLLNASILLPKNLSIQSRIANLATRLLRTQGQLIQNQIKNTNNLKDLRSSVLSSIFN